MLEVSVSHQAAGLSGLGQTSVTRLLTMVHHAGHSGEWYVLWRLCAALGGMGLSVAVLDGSATESAHNPGLRQALLRPALLTTLVADATPWTVMPAAEGLQQIVVTHGHENASSVLGELFAHLDVVLLYAPTPLLVALLPETGAHPLLTLDCNATSVLVNYQSFKQLVLLTQMQPAIAAINLIAHEHGEPQGRHPLQRCARQFLGRDPDWIALNLNQPGVEESDDEVMRLACRMLEIAPALRHNGSVRKDH